MLLLAAADAEEHFGAAVLEIHFERHECEAFFGGLSGELTDFAAVHEELAAALGFVIESVRVGVLGNVRANQPNFRAFDAAIGFVERELASAEALHFAAHQGDSAFERIEHQVIVPGLAIVGDDAFVFVVGPLAAFFRLRRFFRPASIYSSALPLVLRQIQVFGLAAGR